MPDSPEILQKFVAFDLGRVRIGVAASDALGALAHPRGVFKAEGNIAALVASHTREEGAEDVVLGLPRDASGGEGEQAQWVRGIGEKIEKEHGLRVHYWDERLTTVQASSVMRRAGLDTRQQKGKLDQVAAQLILQAFLDARSRKS